MEVDHFSSDGTIVDLVGYDSIALFKCENGIVTPLITNTDGSPFVTMPPT